MARLGYLTFVALAASYASALPSTTDYGILESRGYGKSTLSLIQCLKTKSVPFYVQQSPDWTEYATTFNSRLQYEPAAIALPTTVQHISDSVICASNNGIKVQAKSGGHSYASYSTGGRDGDLMVDLENFNSISLDDSTGVATVGAGVRLGNLALGIWNQGKRALAHGTCPSVGIGGHFTHGGYGYSSRAFGLALDQIVALDVVLANGTFVHANPTSYPEVYYVMRGVADAFGIVTTFYLQTSPAPPTVIQWSYDLPQALTSVSAAVDTFKKVQTFALNASAVDRNLGFGVTIANNATSFTVHGTYFGTEAHFNTTIAPALLEGLPTPAPDSSVEVVDWITSLTLLGGAATLAEPLHGYNERDNFFAKSVTTTEPFPDDALTSFFSYVLNEGAKPPVSWFSIINLYGGPDSQILKYNESFAAYAGHDDLWVIQNYGDVAVNGTYPASGIEFLDGMNNAMTSKLSEYGAYLNYVDPTYSPAEAHQLYYGEELYQKLQKLKAVLDPKNVFSNPQSIQA
ncbi:Glucooligosaccharide oxidase [Diplogelasinospora grovesii]|uniref:Glucooligosaccharide oxidase n=1 Tax=Diplogelasinospora grovesii TaxID=303347 RepID=A0AAN6N9Y8_9PEZI|nr:Glucooligosaccharide oxidase [Diplogelasinospora grovesii]